MNTNITPGTPATDEIGSDCYPALVVDMTPSGKTVWVSRMDPSF